MVQRVSKLVLGTCLAFFAIAPHAQEYPSKPVRIIVPFAAGGPADIYARFIGQRLQDALGQNFIVDNRPGAGAIIGTDAVAKSAADGYTLLMMSNTHTVNESLIPNKPYQLLRDFVPVAPINSSDLVLVVHPSVPANNLGRAAATREVEAEGAELRIIRQWHAVSHGGGIVQGDGRSRHRSHSLQGKLRGAHRLAGRAGADDVRCGPDDG